MKNLITKNKIQTFLLMSFVAITLVLLQSKYTLAADVHISEEVGKDTAESNELADSLDDTWRDQLANKGAVEDDFEAGTIVPGATGINELMTTDNGTVISISVQDMSNLADTSDQGAAANTQGKAGSETASTMQDDAPKPQSLIDQSYYTETSGSTSSPNGIKIDFSKPVQAFGAWFGDLETRTDGQGAPALLRLYDESGVLIGEEQVVEPTVADQGLCGAPVNDNYAGCGNDTTRWIGFIADQGEAVSTMLTIVGEDDANSPDKPGFTEHISLMGFTVVTDYTATAPALVVDPVIAPEPVVITTELPAIDPVAATEPISPVASQGAVDDVVIGVTDVAPTESAQLAVVAEVVDPVKDQGQVLGVTNIADNSAAVVSNSDSQDQQSAAVQPVAENNSTVTKAAAASELANTGASIFTAVLTSILLTGTAIIVGAPDEECKTVVKK